MICTINNVLRDSVNSPDRTTVILLLRPLLLLLMGKDYDLRVNIRDVNHEEFMPLNRLLLMIMHTKFVIPPPLVEPTNQNARSYL